MNHFEYVMVLISIIIGLGIAHILLGLGGIVDRLTGRGDRLRLSVAVLETSLLGPTFDESLRERGRTPRRSTLRRYEPGVG